MMSQAEDDQEPNADRDQALDPTAPALPEPLPSAVRAKVVSLSAEALSRVASDQIPAALRRVASFTPTRRARLASTQIASAIETDDVFRQRIATQVRVVVPEVAKALDAGTPPGAGDPVEVAAMAYLLRPPGWETLVRAGAGHAVTEAIAANQESLRQTAESLRAQLADARTEARTARLRYRDQITSLKSENAELRRRVSDLRGRVRLAEKATATSAADQAEERGRAASELGALEAETRRLRARVAELEAGTSAARRASKDERNIATLRARLLLDTVLEAAAGLRRELGLPAVAGSPAETVDARTPPTGVPGPGTRAQAVDDPGLLEELLALPRAHLVVDGYNVTKSAWPTATLETQRSRLLQGLASIVARHGAEVTVVFDGADLVNPPLVNGSRGVRVLFSPPGVIADQVIRDLVDAEPEGRPVVVASSDREVADGVIRSGARATASSSLVRLLNR
jgi:predicted RNA-binding protein with PIN domain